MGYPVFPNIPAVPGVPSLLRFPASLPTAAKMVGAIVGNTLSVSSITSGALLGSSVLSGTGLISGTKVLNQLTGLVGGVGTYAIDAAQTFSGALTSVFTPPSLGEVPALTGDSPNLGNLAGQNTAQQWGIFDSGGKSVIKADTVAAIDYDQDWRIATFPIEADDKTPGSFSSYDKVSTPFSALLRFASGGAVSNKAQLLSSIDAIAGDLKLYQVVTPEAIYINANIGRYRYSRTALDGKGVLKVDVEVIQIRETTSTTVKSTAQPAGAGKSSGGTKQPQAPTPAQQSLASQAGDSIRSWFH